MVNVDRVTGAVIIGVLGIICIVFAVFAGALSIACCIVGLILGVIAFAMFLVGLVEDNEPVRIERVSAQPPPPGPGLKRYYCIDCGEQLVWVAQYQRWFCKRCRKYP